MVRLSLIGNKQHLMMIKYITTGMQLYTVSLLALLTFFAIIPVDAQELELSSPDKELIISVTIGDKLYFSIALDNEDLLQSKGLSMTLKDEVLGANPKLISKKFSTTNKE